jgi:hypothetical protein
LGQKAGGAVRRAIANGCVRALDGRTVSRPIQAVAVIVLFHFAGTCLGHADMIIRDDPGGLLKKYDAKYREIAVRGEKVVIDGECASACTIILGIVPRANVCVTARARFGFHLWEYPLTEFMGKVIMVPFPEYRQAELNYLYYDAQVRDWIARHGPQTAKAAWMEGADLAGIYASCGARAPVDEQEGNRARLPPN